MNTMYKTVYTIQRDSVQKGELAKVHVKIDDNPYHNIEMEAPNIEFFDTPEEATKALREKLEKDMAKLGEKLEEL